MLQFLKNKDFLGPSIFFYGMSLLLPVFIGAGYLGIAALIFGIGSITDFDTYYGIPWLANFFYFLNLFIKRKLVKLKILVSILTIVAAMFAFGITEVPRYESHDTEVIPGFGFYLWLLSFLVLLIGQILDLKFGIKRSSFREFY